MKARTLTRKAIIEALKAHYDVLQKYKVRRIGLFGSYARGEPHKKSDIDFLVDFSEPTFDNFMELIFHLGKTGGVLGKTGGVLNSTA